MAAGIANLVVPLFVREVVPNELSGQLGAWYHCLYELGYLSGTLLGLFIPSEFSYVNFLLTSPFAIIMTVFLLVEYKVESPTFLWLKGKKKDAIYVCNTLYF